MDSIVIPGVKYPDVIPSIHKCALTSKEPFGFNAKQSACARGYLCKSNLKR